MIVYAESSAVLSWLFGEPKSESVRHALEKAAHVVTSRLTRLECLRGIVRAEATGRVSKPDAERLLNALARASAQWTVIDVAPEVLDRAADPFPVEPVRTLDAIHIATLLVVRAASDDVQALALDDRVRANALRLGVPVLPA